VVTRSATGEYLATLAPSVVDDVHHELEAELVPTFITADAGASLSSTGVRSVER